MKTKRPDYYELRRNILVSEILVVITNLIILLLPQNTLETVKNVMVIVSYVFLCVSLVMFILATKRNRVFADEMVHKNEEKASQFAFTVLLSMLVVFLAMDMLFEIKIVLTASLAAFICYSILMAKDACFICLERGAHKNVYAENED